MPDSAAVPAALRREVGQRASYLCEYCRAPEEVGPDPFSVEHIIPQSAGGNTISGNLAYSCQGCNGHKHVRTHAVDPLTGEDAPLYNPRQANWSDHFAWSEDRLEVLGSTPTGRATVELLHLNRRGLLNLRRALIAMGQHPPADEVPEDE